jgi:hypothetical protein
MFRFDPKVFCILLISGKTNYPEASFGVSKGELHYAP